MFYATLVTASSCHDAAMEYSGSCQKCWKHFVAGIWLKPKRSWTGPRLSLCGGLWKCTWRNYIGWSCRSKNFSRKCLSYIKHRNPPSWAAQDFSSTKTKNVCLPKWWISANPFIWVKIVWSLDSQQLCHNGIASFGHTNTHMITHEPFWYLLDPNINLFKKNQSILGITRPFFWRRAQGESHHHSHCHAVILSIKAAHDALRMDATRANQLHPQASDVMNFCVRKLSEWKELTQGEKKKTSTLIPLQKTLSVRSSTISIPRILIFRI